MVPTQRARFCLLEAALDVLCPSPIHHPMQLKPVYDRRRRLRQSHSLWRGLSLIVVLSAIFCHSPKYTQLLLCPSRDLIAANDHIPMSRGGLGD